MLEKVREPWRASRTKSILAYTLFGFICLTFVFVGVSPNDGGSVGTAATVNSKVISLYDFQERVQALENQAGSRLSSLPPAQRQAQGKRIRESALNELVNYEVVFQSAEHIGVLPTQAATRDLIVSIPSFQEEGRFMRERYDRYLEYSNTTAGEFEGRVKRDVVIGQVRELFFAALKTPKVMEVLDSEVRGTKLNVEFLKIDSAALTGALAPSPADVSAYLAKEENKKSVQSYYESHKSDYSSKEEVRARHILIKGSDDATLKKIKEVQELSQKTDFAELAKQYSQDEGSKARGGDLNFFSRGAMVPEFEAVAFSLPVGRISDPVKTSFGYHLIKVEEKKGGEAKKLEDVQADIAKRLMVDAEKDKLLADLSTALKEKKDLAPWISRLKLKWEETGEVNLNATALPKVDSTEAFDAALSLAKPGEIYGGLIQSGDVSYILKLKNVAKAENKAQDISPFFMGYSGGGVETLGIWADELKKSARISRNESLLQ